MTTRTKPVRIFESDHAPLRLAALAEGRSVAEVFHSALAEYFEVHRERLTALYDDTRDAIATGDLDRITTHLLAGADERIDSMMAGD